MNSLPQDAVWLYLLKRQAVLPVHASIYEDIEVKQRNAAELLGRR